MSRSRDLANLAGDATGLETLTVSDITDLTATATELNKLDGVTADTNELNKLDGVTATTTELNYVDGVSSALQTQIDAKAPTASPTFTGTTTVADFVPATPLSHRNLIINGAMQVWQRNTDVTCSDGSNEDYNSVDRWQPNFNGGCPGTLDIDRSTDTPDGFGYSTKLKCNATGTPSSANQMAQWRYKVEAQDLQHLNYGSSSAKVMTLSWYMKSVNYTSPLSFYFIKYDNTFAYYVKSVTPTTSWARYSITIPANTNSGHGIDNDNGLGFEIGIVLAGTSGGTYEQTGDSTAWGTTSKYFTNTQGNFFSSTSNELYITGVQLELGSVATPFEHRSYADELLRCQRYYYGNANAMGRLMSPDGNPNDFNGSINFAVTMRATPSTEDLSVYEAGTGSTLGGVSVYNINQDSLFFIRTANNSVSDRRAVTAVGFVDAEL